MKFNLNDFLQLDANGLLAVNGGTSCSSSSSSSSSESPSGSSNGPGASPTNPYKANYGGLSGGGGTCSSKSDSPKDSDPTPKTPSNDNPGYKVTTTSNGGTCTTVDLSYWNEEYKKNVQKNMEDSIKDNKDGKEYVKGKYMCDDWVQEVLTDAGIDYKDYFAGDAKDKTCEDHIANLKNSDKEYSTEVPTDKGVYVVLMNDGHEYTNEDGSKGILGAHTGLLVVSDTGAYFADNSSGNLNGVGGVEYTKGNDASAVMSKYGYDSFYFQKVN